MQAFTYFFMFIQMNFNMKSFKICFFYSPSPHRTSFYDSTSRRAAADCRKLSSLRIIYHTRKESKRVLVRGAKCVENLINEIK